MIRHGVGRSYRCGLRCREVEALLVGRGVTVSCEAIRRWCRTYGRPSASQLRRRRPRPGDPWQLDAGLLTSRDARPSRWRAGDPEGDLLDSLVPPRRNQAAAQRCFRPLRTGGQDVPRGFSTDQLESYGAAKRERWPGADHRPHRELTNHAETAPPPARASGAGTDASRPGRPNGSWRRWGHSRRTSARAVPGCRPSSTARRGGHEFTPGRHARADGPPPKGRDSGPHAPTCRDITPTGTKLTKPPRRLPSPPPVVTSGRFHATRLRGSRPARERCTTPLRDNGGRGPPDVHYWRRHRRGPASRARRQGR
jgi:transposase-like protein